jgi:hypothetical protein
MSEPATAAKRDEELLTAWTNFTAAGRRLIEPAAGTTFGVLDRVVETLGAWLPHAPTDEVDETGETGQARRSGTRALTGDVFIATGNSMSAQLNDWCATSPATVDADEILRQSGALHQFRVHLTTLLDFIENGTPHASDGSQPRGAGTATAATG